MSIGCLTEMLRTLRVARGSVRLIYWGLPLILLLRYALCLDLLTLELDFLALPWLTKIFPLKMLI